jgi:PhnB protein
MTEAAAETVAIPGVSPYLTIKGGRGQEAVEFYGAAFGAAEAMRHLGQDGHRLMHSRLVINGAVVMLSDDFPDFNNGVEAPDPASVTLHLQVDDADAWWDRAVKAGAAVRMPLANQFWGDRYGQLTDPFGHRWSIGGPQTSE